MIARCSDVLLSASVVNSFKGLCLPLVSLGSDAEYLPIAIARALQPETQKGKKIQGKK